MIRTQIQIDDKQVKWLKTTSQRKGVSMSQLIRESIDFYRAHEDRSDSKKRALAAVGRFASGIADISERHDDYLSDSYVTERDHGK